MKLKKITRAILTTISYFCFILNSLFVYYFLCVCFNIQSFPSRMLCALKLLFSSVFTPFISSSFWIFVFSSVFLCEGIILSLILCAQKYMMSGVKAFEIFGLHVFTRVNMQIFLFDERNNEWRKLNVMYKRELPISQTSFNAMSNC